ncbi:uncharacterized protein HMPREF1541_04682 [Cyphellophora europaea CBS 101466]|uniref:non-specific serine/threonine protein kinase n=1 Tax=Cyphellophora europaea (strain CBS 101466) TaxID=1220924 RepID=W2RVS9_CYPE1|nr:uncharacterized protein HMPREF1541_04682 [Cyphellophora europaea CBS 101466]ETN40405.1 hypothetical protein HMPREF1541_04682 [Cyphellophora europaea CBS 101466]
MARKKANKAKGPVAPTTPFSPDKPPESPPPGFGDADGGIDSYPEVQQNEYLATQAIYPDEFVRVHGRKDAWKDRENLAFQVRLTSLENPEFFIKIEIEFPGDYPKVPLKAKVITLEPDIAKVRTQLDLITKNVTKAHIGSECVHEVTGAIDELLNRSALSKAEKANPFSLEEERAKQEAAARLASQQAQDQLRQQQRELEAKGRQELVSRLDTERKRREHSRAKGKTSDMETCNPISVDFERPLFCKDAIDGHLIEFTKVDGRAATLRRDDKINRLVSPQVPNNDSVNVPTLLLKQIMLRKDLISPDDMLTTMMKVEKLLQESCKLEDVNIVSIIGYKLEYPDEERGKEEYNLYILSEFSWEGSLRQVIHAAGQLAPAKVREYTRQIIQALWFFETHNFVHPAVHTGNLIIFRSHGQSAPIVKLSDGYGTALRELVDKARDNSNAPTVLPPLWRAPELIENAQAQTAPTSMWNLGRIILEMLLGTSIYEEYTSPRDCLKKQNLDTGLSELLYKLFKPDPSARPSADELKTSSFLFQHGPLIIHAGWSIEGLPGSARSGRVAPSRWNDDWESLGRLGKGGFGSVYKARKLADQAVYAVKLIRAYDRKQLEEYRSEVLNLARLQHPSIVRYYDSWAEADDSSSKQRSLEDTTYTETYSPPVEPNPSMSKGNAMAESYLADQYTQNFGRSGLEAMNPAGQRNDATQSPAPPRFQVTEGSAPHRVAPNDSNDQSDASEPQYDDSDDYDNAYAGDAKVDSALFRNDFSDDKARVPRHKDSSLQQDGPLEEESEQGGVAVVSAEVVVPTQPRKTTRSSSTFTEGVIYIQMEYCEGKTLKYLVGESLCDNVNLAWQLLRGILEGLDYIHANGIAHRDLKPDNIFLGAGQTPKIGDFGLAVANAAKKGSEVGTMFYIAPELNRGLDITDYSKVDMFSLGIILFEMSYHLPTTSGRYAMLDAIGKDVGNIPQRLFDDPKYKEQALIIRDLLSHQPADRPSANALLNGGKIPEPIEESKLERRLEWMAQHDPKKLASMLVKRKNTDLQDLAWEYIPTADDEPIQSPLLLGTVKDRLEATFRKHGAVMTSRQALLPIALETSAAAVAVLNDDLITLQLRKDLTTPLARTLAKTKPQHNKIFCFADIYEARNEHGNTEPLHFPRANFDFVSHKATDLALKEATTIYIIQDFIGQVPALLSVDWTVVLNHMDILDLILEHCDIRQEHWLNMKALLSRYPFGRLNEKQRQQHLKAFGQAARLQYNVADTSLAGLGKFASIRGEPKEVRRALQTAFGKSKAMAATALARVSRLEEIISYLQRLNFSHKVVIAPLSASDAHLYEQSIVFQCINDETSQPLANGGRYDELIKYHARGSSDPAPRAVGLSFNLEKVAKMLVDATVADASAAKGKNKPGKAGASTSSSAAVSSASAAQPSRCDVLVTSFDPELLTTHCMDVLRELWTAGISAELTEEVESMEQLEEEHGGDGPYWLVMVRVVAGEVVVKVRSPVGEEQGVEMEGLAAWLRVEVRRGRKGGK